MAVRRGRPMTQPRPSAAGDLELHPATPKLDTAAVATSGRVPLTTAPLPSATTFITGSESFGVSSAAMPSCGMSHRATHNEPSDE